MKQLSSNDRANLWEMLSQTSGNWLFSRQRGGIDILKKQIGAIWNTHTAYSSLLLTKNKIIRRKYQQEIALLRGAALWQIHRSQVAARYTMGWLRLVGSLKL
jgi:hypothetical protein